MNVAVMQVLLMVSEFAPHHLVDHSGIALNEFDYLGGDRLRVVGYGYAVVPVVVHFDGQLYTLEQSFRINAAEYEASLVECFRTFGAGANADSCDGMAYAGEETAFLGQGAAITDHAEGIHL